MWLCQVEREIKWKEENDHELLHLYMEATKSNYPKPDQCEQLQLTMLISLTCIFVLIVGNINFDLASIIFTHY